MQIYNFTRSSDGQNIEMRVQNNILEWRYENDLEWKPLLLVDSIGVKDYEKLSNLPSIDGVKLTGDIDLDTLSLIKGWVGTTEEFENIKDQLDPETICHIIDDTESTIETDNSDLCIHLSFDSVEICISNIIKNAYDSLFDEPFFGWLESLHEKFDAKFSLYISNLQQLESIPDKYVNEFFSARKWLKFGICSRNKEYVYGDSIGEDAEEDWDLFINQVLRFTGSFESIDRVPRLNNYTGTGNSLVGMKEQDCGALGFLTSPYIESSYYLNETQNNYLTNHDRLFDLNYGLVFFHTDICVEWFMKDFTTDKEYDIPVEETIINEIIRRFKIAKFADTFRTFIISCDESTVYSGDNLQNISIIEDICTFGNGYCIPFDYPQNRIGDISGFQYVIG